MIFNYAVLAVSPETGATITEREDFQILASTWYEKLPTQEDIEALYEEYQTDEELGMVGVPFVLIWREDDEFNNNLRETLGLKKEIEDD